MIAASLPAGSSSVRAVAIAGGIVLLAAAGLLLGLRILGPRDSIERLVRSALAEGRLDEASSAVAHWLRASPDSAEAHFFKARIAWARNDLAPVGKEWTHARALGYSWQALARLRGLLLARANQASEAERFLREAFESAHGNDPEVAEALARIYLAAFRLDDAAHILDRWSQAAPRDALPYLLRAEVDIRSEASPEVAIARYRAALLHDPSLA